MIEFYKNQINMGVLTIEQVPAIWRDKVRQALNGETVEPLVIDKDILQKANAYDIIIGGVIDDTD